MLQFKPFNKFDAEKSIKRPKKSSKTSKSRQKTAAEELEQIRSAWYNYYRKLKVCDGFQQALKLTQVREANKISQLHGVIVALWMHRINIENTFGNSLLMWNGLQKITDHSASFVTVRYVMDWAI